MASVRVQLPEPCPARWKNMTPAQGGRFCASCEKTVIDFSKMNTEAIGAYFKAHAAAGFCGNFALHQVDTPKSKKEEILGKWYATTERHVRFAPARWLALLLLSSLLVLSGCRVRTGGAPRWNYEASKDRSAPARTE